MQIGMVGLGRMGGNMARRLMRGGHKVVAWARNAKVVQELAGEGAVGTTTLDDFVAKLAAPRVAWVMVPAGAATEQVVMDLARRLSPGDTLIDGGNSYFKDDVRRSRALRERRINYRDVGTSGGVWGLERGYCLMIGGDRAVVERLDPIFRTLAPGMGTISRTPGRETQGGTAEHGYLYCGPSGAGHFVKMVHNGIEYGLMQAYAERSEEHTSELQSLAYLVCRLLLEKKKNNQIDQRDYLTPLDFFIFNFQAVAQRDHVVFIDLAFISNTCTIALRAEFHHSDKYIPLG